MTANSLKIDLPKTEIKFQQIRSPVRGYNIVAIDIFFFYCILQVELLGGFKVEIVDLARSLKLLSTFKNLKRLEIFFLIAQKPNLRFKDLRRITKLDSNDLNHTLISLRDRLFIDSDEEGYRLTKIGQNVAAGLQRMMDDPAVRDMIAQMKEAKLVRYL